MTEFAEVFHTLTGSGYHNPNEYHGGERETRNRGKRDPR